MIINSAESVKKAATTLKEKHTGEFQPIVTSYPHLNELCNGGIIPGKTDVNRRPRGTTHAS